MTHSNKRETPAEDDKNTAEQTIEEQLKEAREEVLNIFKEKKQVEKPSASSDSQNDQALGN